mmetsp:Transcript_6568/g.12372  ORF Transcript_6568/g.12372 Transcript_6568/m.12372 type:complete len:476 (+) Transcript_6568:119-1546(+)
MSPQFIGHRSQCQTQFRRKTPSPITYPNQYDLFFAFKYFIILFYLLSLLVSFVVVESLLLLGPPSFHYGDRTSCNTSHILSLIKLTRRSSRTSPYNNHYLSRCTIGGTAARTDFGIALLLSTKQQDEQEENSGNLRKKGNGSSTNNNSPSTKTSQSSSTTFEQTDNGIRLNKVFKQTHSRRQADDLIASGRVTVNGRPVVNKGGFMVVPYRDIIAVDGKVVKGWEHMNGIDDPALCSSIASSSPQKSSTEKSLKTEQFEYVKYFKPLGVTCTTDVRIRDNIIDSILRDGYLPPHRVFPVGRLDKETTGLIILTSDGRLVNSVLRGEMKQPKVYKVMVDGRLDDIHLERLRNGVTITTVAQRKGKTVEENTLVAKTKPCLVERLGPCSCKMTLVEGRNRQIRKMMEALGFTVIKLHRVEFMGIRLGESKTSKGLNRPGDWAYLNESEMDLVIKALLKSSSSSYGSTQDHASLDEDQ